MIDTSVYLLWDDRIGDNEVLVEAFRDAAADCGRARRLQVVMAEARAAGAKWSTIAQIVVDWIGMVAPLLPKKSLDERDGLRILRHELDAARALIAGKDFKDEAPFDILEKPAGDPQGRPRMSSTPAGQLALTLNNVLDPIAYWIMHGEVDPGPGLTDDDNNKVVAAWLYSAEVLAVVYELAGPVAIDRCAELAYARLFPKAA